MEMGVVTSLFDMLSPQVQDLSGLTNLVFYREVNGFLRDEIGEFQQNLVGRMMVFFGAIALMILTFWIWWQGFRIVTGRSRESLMGLVVDSLRATLVIAFATGFAAANSQVYDKLTEGMGSVIVNVVTGDDVGTDGLYTRMDNSLALMSLALGSVEAIQVRETPGDGSSAETNKSRNMYFAGWGTAGPAVTAGVMLTLNKIAMALFVGLGPLFIMCLLFDQTKSLFQRWLLYGVGTWFSLAVLYVMVILAMDLTLAVGAAFWVGKFMEVAGQQGVNSMAIQQAGLGTILTMLLITAPGMAANFFQGTLGQFIHYSMFDQNSRNVPSAQGSAGSGRAPDRQSSEQVTHAPTQVTTPRLSTADSSQTQSQLPGTRGLANTN